ncbi:glycosyltransferase family 2 protein [Candidatus Peregrinibacteria bacterium]|nr:MAG: glycosyltransferase family 2 protein [Candidatus Peregrinibacteria bacterium]
MEKQEKLDFSIIIPAYNEAKNLPRLFASISHIDYPKEKLEIVVVDDASQDETLKLKKKYESIHFIQHKENRGRFATRKTGALTAKGKWILFLDARTIPFPDILKNISKLPYDIILGHSLPQEKETIFEILFRAIREKFFSRFYREKEGIILLTTENFDSYPKGTTLLCVRKEVFIKAYTVLDEKDFGKDSSDDTKVLRFLVGLGNMAICPTVRVISYGRNNFFQSALHLFLRGAKFFDYYGTREKKNFWLVLIIPVILGTMLITFLWAFPKIGLLLFGATWILLSFWLSGMQKRFLPIFLMLPIVTTLFYLGIIRGILLKIFATERK